jgi:transcriptional regulator with XRE-family HTH domain
VNGIPGPKLREVREAARVTQAEVARKMGVSPSRISTVESGRREPEFDWSARYLAALGTRAAIFVHVRAFVDDVCVIESSESFDSVEP